MKAPLLGQIPKIKYPQITQITQITSLRPIAAWEINTSFLGCGFPFNPREDLIPKLICVICGYTNLWFGFNQGVKENRALKNEVLISHVSIGLETKSALICVICGYIKSVVRVKSRHFGAPLEFAQNTEDDATLLDDIVLTIDSQFLS